MGAEGKPIPTELRNDEAKLRSEVELEDDNTAVQRTHVDDEYAHAGEVDPKVRRVVAGGRGQRVPSSGSGSITCHLVQSSGTPFACMWVYVKRAR